MKAPPSQGTKPGEGTRTLCREYRDGMLCTNGSRRCILGNDHRPCKFGASCKRRYTSCSFGHPPISSSSSSPSTVVGADRPSHATNARSSNGVPFEAAAESNDTDSQSSWESPAAPPPRARGNEAASQGIRRTAPPPPPPLSPLHLSPAPSPHPQPPHSHTMSSTAAATPNGSATTTASPPKPALLLIDGGHLRVFVDRLMSGHRGMTTRQMEDTRVCAVETLVRVMSRTFHLSFVRKILHEGTHTGQPSRFHEQISHPDGAFILPRIRGMKPKTARPYNLSTCSVEADKPPCTILVEKGVDVALCVDLTGDPLSHEEEYRSILVLSGDGDLEEALKVAARKRTVHVISMRGALAPSLNGFVKQVDGKGVWLDDLLQVDTGKIVTGTTPQPTISMRATAPSPTPPSPYTHTGTPHTHTDSPHTHTVYNRTNGHATRSAPASRDDNVSQRRQESFPLDHDAGAEDGSDVYTRQNGARVQPRDSAHVHTQQRTTPHHTQQQRVKARVVGKGVMAEQVGGVKGEGGDGVGRGGSGGAAAASGTNTNTGSNPTAHMCSTRVHDGGDGRDGGGGGGHDDVDLDDDDDDAYTQSASGTGGVRDDATTHTHTLPKCPHGSACEMLARHERDGGEGRVEEDVHAHVHSHRHPCPAGMKCAYIGYRTTAFNMPEKKAHTRLFSHLCKYGRSCPRRPPMDAQRHRAAFYHPAPKAGERGSVCVAKCCPKIKSGSGFDAEHMLTYVHPCPYKSQCRLLRTTDPAAQAQRQEHMKRWLHPCVDGNQCPRLKDQDWNHVHLLRFSHGHIPLVTSTYYRRAKPTTTTNTTTDPPTTTTTTLNQQPPPFSYIDEEAQVYHTSADADVLMTASTTFSSSSSPLSWSPRCSAATKSEAWEEKGNDASLPPLTDHDVNHHDDDDDDGHDHRVYEGEGYDGVLFSCGGAMGGVGGGGDIALPQQQLQQHQLQQKQQQKQQQQQAGVMMMCLELTPAEKDLYANLRGDEDNGDDDDDGVVGVSGGADGAMFGGGGKCGDGGGDGAQTTPDTAAETPVDDDGDDHYYGISSNAHYGFVDDAEGGHDQDDDGGRYGTPADADDEVVMSHTHTQTPTHAHTDAHTRVCA